MQSGLPTLYRRLPSHTKRMTWPHRRLWAGVRRTPHFYERGIEDVFAGQADFAQLVKLFGDFGQFDSSEARYSPQRITEVIYKVRDGRPDKENIRTTHVERSNLSLRTHLRRF